ncbi:MAG: hypothetical protein R3E83_11195 [Burkholderiaceae bacterium]
MSRPGALMEFRLLDPMAAPGARFPRSGTAPSMRVRHFGLPMARGQLAADERVILLDAAGSRMATQTEVASRWPDGSVRWLRVWLALPAALELPATFGWDRASGEGAALAALAAADGCAVLAPETVVHAAREDDGAVQVTRGGRVWHWAPGSDAVLSERGEHAVLASSGAQLVLRDADGRRRVGRIHEVMLRDAGPLTTCVRIDGDFGDDCPVRFRLRWRLTAGSPGWQGELRLRNVRAAKHPGGFWDLGDPGSWRVRDCSLIVPLANPAGAGSTMHWRADGAWQSMPASASAPATAVAATDDALVIYQDSSGGESWDSPNHVGADGALTVRFRGYEVRAGASVAGPW